MKRPFLLAAAVLITALLLASCIVLPTVQQSASPLPTAAPETAVPTAETATQTAPPASPTAAPVPIDFAPVNNGAANKLAQVLLGANVQDALSILGQPKAVYGKGSYRYKAIADGADSVPASVYRFEIDGFPVELIVRERDGVVLRKQISAHDVFAPIMADASSVQIADGSAYGEALATLDANPYLWIEFLLPEDAAGAQPYQVAIWPDANGQYAAVVKDGIVLRSEYQTLSTVPEAATVDGVTPRVPRFLRPLPGVANEQVAHNPRYLNFAKLKLNAPEAEVLSAFGQPTGEDTSNPALRVLTYEIASADFSGEKLLFSLTFSTGEHKVLVAKNAVILPKSDTDLRARYALQILGGMKISDLGKTMFRHNSLATNQYIDPDGRVIESYSWMANRAMVNALVPQGSDTVIGSNFALYDTDQEAACLYEEYVLAPLPTGSTATAVPTPKVTPTPRPPVTVKPSLSFALPSLSPVIPSLESNLPTPTPTPPAALTPRVSLRLPSAVLPSLTLRLPSKIPMITTY